MMAQAAYVHIPFCRHRCAYCNFTVVADRLDLEFAYLNALERELEQLIDPRPVRTVFVGGGTPTEISRDGLQRLCRLINHWFPRPNSDAETTFEANPDGLDAERVAVLADHGVNRVSLGIQSFQPSKLQRLDRQHTLEEIHQAIRLLRDHFRSFSLDLIFAAPEESLDDWERDLELAIRSQPNHVSTYGLTVEQGTLFWNRRARGELVEVDENLQSRMYRLAIERLGAAGFKHYEVSNFCQPGFRCQHNETYWLGEEYYAVGAGASRYINGRRETNHRSTSTYIRRMLAGESPVAESESIDDEERSRERLVFGLRRLEGINMAAFERENPHSINSLAGEHLPMLVDEKLLEITDGRLRLTQAGLLVSDSIWPHFL